MFRILQGIDPQDIVLHWVDTETEVADTLTKPLCRVKHSALWTPSSTHSSIALARASWVANLYPRSSIFVAV
jgi:hypothetical protein